MKPRKPVAVSIVFLGVLGLGALWVVLRSGTVRYEYILPNDFVGDITVIYHPKGPDSVPINYFGKTTIRIEVPNSGIVVTPDYERLFYSTDDEVWRYRDGRVIKTWPNVLAPGFTFVGSSGGGSVSGIDKSDPLFKWAEWDNRSSYWKITSTRYSVRK